MKHLAHFWAFTKHPVELVALIFVVIFTIILVIFQSPSLGAASSRLSLRIHGESPRSELHRDGRWPSLRPNAGPSRQMVQQARV